MTHFAHKSYIVMHPDSIQLNGFSDDHNIKTITVAFMHKPCLCWKIFW